MISALALSGVNSIMLIRLHIVPLGTNSESSLPKMSAMRFYNAIVVRSSPKTSSPTIACAIACRMFTQGLVTVSDLKSLKPVVFRAASSIEAITEEAEFLAKALRA